MKKILVYLVIVISILFSFRLAFGQEKPVLFWSQGCPHCHIVINYLEKNKIKDHFALKEVHSSENSQDFQKVIGQCHIPLERAGVPLLATKDKCILGDEDIIGFIKNKEVFYFKRILPTSTQLTVSQIDLKQTPIASPKSFSSQQNKNQFQKNKLTWPLIIGGALADSINPCAFAVLIIFLTTVLVSNKKSKVLVSAFSFIGAIYLSYLAMGLGGWKIFNLSGYSNYFVKGAGILAIILGILNFKDFLKYGGFGFVMEIPFSWRPSLKKIISFLGFKKASEECKVCKNKCIKQPVASLNQDIGGFLGFIKRLSLPLAAFLIGLAISLFLLPCTSGPYIVILGLLSKSSTFLKALKYLLAYNLIFILPMVFIALAVYFGLDPKKIEKLRQKNIKIIHLGIALLLLAIGFYVLFVF